VRAASAEVDVYVDPEKTAAALATATDKTQAKSWFDLQYALFYPYIKAGSFHPFQGDVSLSPGIRSLATPGHTPGHTSYVVESHGQTLIVIGDLVHWASVQFRYPRAYTVFDADPKASIEQRLRVFKMAAHGDEWIAGAHLPFPGIGHVRAGEGRYYWIPIDYSIPER
jgi:glyoxylase-like metal-dependent hydrolase (beta-lactamase superfamily II)